VRRAYGIMVDKCLNDYFDQYDAAITGIRHCAAAYEERCVELIFIIFSCEFFEESGVYFNELYDIHTQLSSIYFDRDIALGSNAIVFTKNFHKSDNVSIKEYWYHQIKAGLKWPLEL
jgi:hypothetical protein